MNNYSRLGKCWTINECLQLQREFELLNLSIDEISSRHKRTPNSIMFKLDAEGLADYNILYSNYHMLNQVLPLQKTNKFEGMDDEIDDDIVEQDDEDQEYIPEEDSDSDSDNDDDHYVGDEDDLKAHVFRLEKQVMALTEMFMKSNIKCKSALSLLS
jgi:hypothetical protein